MQSCVIRLNSIGSTTKSPAHGYPPGPARTVYSKVGTCIRRMDVLYSQRTTESLLIPRPEGTPSERCNIALISPTQLPKFPHSESQYREAKTRGFTSCVALSDDKRLTRAETVAKKGGEKKTKKTYERRKLGRANVHTLTYVQEFTYRKRYLNSCGR